jgi:uncharacterized repeat protein (TIGR03833 family)
MKATDRKNVAKGTHVRVVRKEDQRSGKLTEGIVEDVLTRSAVHPHGIKVRLTSGVVGRVKEILKGELKDVPPPASGIGPVRP